MLRATREQPKLDCRVIERNPPQLTSEPAGERSAETFLWTIEKRGRNQLPRGATQQILLCGPRCEERTSAPASGALDSFARGSEQDGQAWALEGAAHAGGSERERSGSADSEV